MIRRAQLHIVLRQVLRDPTTHQHTPTSTTSNICKSSIRAYNRIQSLATTSVVQENLVGAQGGKPRFGGADIEVWHIDERTGEGEMGKGACIVFDCLPYMLHHVWRLLSIEVPRLRWSEGLEPKEEGGIDIARDDVHALHAIPHLFDLGIQSFQPPDERF